MKPKLGALHLRALRRAQVDRNRVYESEHCIYKVSKCLCGMCNMQSLKEAFLWARTEKGYAKIDAIKCFVIPWRLLLSYFTSLMHWRWNSSGQWNYRWCQTASRNILKNLHSPSSNIESAKNVTSLMIYETSESVQQHFLKWTVKALAFLWTSTTDMLLILIAAITNSTETLMSTNGETNL